MSNTYNRSCTNLPKNTLPDQHKMPQHNATQTTTLRSGKPRSATKNVRHAAPTFSIAVSDTTCVVLGTEGEQTRTVISRTICLGR